jgi:hypothetical protein
MIHRLIAPLLAALVLQGCANMLHDKPADRAAVPATSPALDAFATARAQELTQARQALAGIEGASSNLQPNEQAHAVGIATSRFEAVDGKTQLTRSVEIFDRLSMDLPLSLKGKPERDALMAPVKVLTEYLANQRGAAEIVRSYAPADARSEHVTAEGATVKNGAGHDITVRKQVDAAVPQGSERVTVMGGPLSKVQ